jgi:endonuclease/exonuclease/phosphatase family metal-dependent hydrolase
MSLRRSAALAAIAVACTPTATPAGESTAAEITSDATANPSGVEEASDPSATASDDVTSAGSTSTTPDATTGGPEVCSGTTLRAVAYNVEAVGSTGSDEWNALGSVLRRIGPDIACIEEVDENDVGPLRDLAAALEWPEPIFADTSPAIGGELRNACLGPQTITRIASWGSELSGDGGANDVGRDLLAVEVTKDACSLAIIAIHAKSGQEPIDLFRRQVEFVRVGQAIAALREDGHDAVVVMGDFNENLGDEVLGTTLTEIPASLPRSYRLGEDITLPMTYDPFALLEAAGMERLDPTREDSDAVGTWGVDEEWDGVRLDYVFFDQVEPERALVYFACDDDGVDAPPVGAWIPLVGDPLPCFASRTASDHLPVVVDLALQP